MNKVLSMTILWRMNVALLELLSWGWLERLVVNREGFHASQSSVVAVFEEHRQNEKRVCHWTQLYINKQLKLELESEYLLEHSVFLTWSLLHKNVRTLGRVLVLEPVERSKMITSGHNTPTITRFITHRWRQPLSTTGALPVAQIERLESRYCLSQGMSWTSLNQITWLCIDMEDLACLQACSSSKTKRNRPKDQQQSYM